MRSPVATLGSGSSQVNRWLGAAVACRSSRERERGASACVKLYKRQNHHAKPPPRRPIQNEPHAERSICCRCNHSITDHLSLFAPRRFEWRQSCGWRLDSDRSVQSGADRALSQDRGPCGEGGPTRGDVRGAASSLTAPRTEVYWERSGTGSYGPMAPSSVEVWGRRRLFSMPYEGVFYTP